MPNGTGAWIRSLSTRSQSLGSSSAFPHLMMTPAATANVGIKAVRAGISKSVKVVANSAQTIYHASENKLQMGNLMNGVTPGLMHWMTGRDRGYLAIVVTGTLSIYPVKQVSTPRKGRPPVIRARISKRPFEERLHKIPDDQFPPAFRARIENKFHPPGSATKSLPPPAGGTWHLRAPHGGADDGAARRRPENWHALVEAETNPPYQPFHTDRRVTLMTFSEPEPSPFGPIPVVPGHVSSREDEEAEEEHADGDEEGEDDSGAYYGEHADEEPPAGDAPSWERAVLAPWLRDAHHAGLPSAGAATEHAPWIFGRDVPAARAFPSAGGNPADASDDDLAGSAVENKIHVVEGAEGEQVIVTTMRRKGREEEFFEDGCEVVDFADDRV